jgi:hypothetical protein
VTESVPPIVHVENSCALWELRVGRNTHGQAEIFQAVEAQAVAVQAVGFQTVEVRAVEVQTVEVQTAELQIAEVQVSIHAADTQPATDIQF